MKRNGRLSDGNEPRPKSPNRRPLKEIETKAVQVLRGLGLWQLPINPLKIAALEEIEVCPGDYDPRFNGRIKYVKEIETFVLHYRRTRYSSHFTISHELGHFYLHRSLLIDGHSHYSEPDYRSDDPVENEADDFAASLLMPRELFSAEVKKFRTGVCDLTDLCKLATRVGSSLTSTIRRYCQCDIEPCLVVFSRDGRIQWSEHSEDMKHLGMWFVNFGSCPPDGSVTSEVWQTLPATNSLGIARREVDSEVWFDWPKRPRIWEEVMPLGQTGIVLTFLTLPL